MSYYEITEEDIGSTLNYLEIFHPDKAHREFAVAMLEYMKAGYHKLSGTDPEGLEELLKAFEASRKSSEP